MGSLVVREDRNGLATLRLNRPEKLNSLNVAVFVELNEHLAVLEQQTDVIGLVVLRGAGKCFSAGHDLGDIAEGEHSPEPDIQAKTIDRLAKLPQPVISAVHGHCYTGALELALAGDLLLATESAKFADTHAKWALTPIWGMSQRLPRRVGLPKAKEMMLTCRTYSGAEALAIGLANFCVADAEFDTAIASLAESILANSWFSNRTNKKLLADTDGMPLAAGLAHEIHRSEIVGPDVNERIAKFTSKERK